jgi:hypothetical protein
MNKIIKEEIAVKPTVAKPTSELGKNYEKNFKRDMSSVAPDVKLNEVDGMLSEVEQSLKKKIFSLAKMEALVFSDPKLTTVYNEMAENGEEKYGYHYNETIQNMIFNDYVLNSPKYLQKYKMAVPKKKKRRDKSGINQLKKSGEATMKKITPTPQPAPVKNETTAAAGGGAGAFVPALGYEKKVEETTTSASSGAYVGPAAWGSGDLMKTGGKSKAMRKPIWKGGTIIQETKTNYLVDPSGFEKYVQELNEQLDIENPATAQKPNTAPYTNNAVNDKIIDKTSAFTSSTVKQWNKPDTELELNTLNTGKVDDPNFNMMEDMQNEGISPDMYTTKEDLKQLAQSVRQRTGKGLTKDHIPMLAGEALYTIAIQMANKYLANKGLPIDWEELPDTNSMWDYIDENGGMRFQDLQAAVKEAVDDRISEGGFGEMGDMFNSMDESINEKAKSPAQQRLFGMAHAAQKGDMPMSKLGGAAKKIAQTVDPQDVEDFASTKHSEMNEEMGVNEYILTVKHDKGTVNLKTTASSEDAAKKKIMAAEGCPESAITSVKLTKKIAETAQSIIDDKPDTMTSKGAVGTAGAGNVPMGMTDMKESFSLLEELNNELEAYSIHQNKLMKMAEDRKPSALVLRDRVGSENETNFKKDLQHSGTKEVIDVEKELMWKDQQTEVGKDPQKLGQDIEKKEIDVTDADGDEALKNVGDSANDKGDEIPKRNFTKDEQDEVDMYRLGQHSIVYDNEPGKRFEDRMKADMGDKIYKMRQEQLKFRAKAPLYNRESVPTEDGAVEKVQFDKEKSGWNEREGLKESMITGRFHDILNKRRLIDFTLNEVKLVEKVSEGLFELDFTGLGNSYNSKTQDYKVSVNETVTNVIAEHKFYTDGKIVFAVKNPVQKLNENEQKVEKPVVNEQVNKMKHLLGYKPNDYVNTKNIKL